MNEQLNLLPDLGEKFDLTGFTFGLATQVQQVGHYAKPQNEGGTNQVGQATIADFLGSVCRRCASGHGRFYPGSVDRKRGQR